MPIFEYKCNDCGHEFEELVFDREECPPCPKCQSEKTGKLMSAVRSKVGGFRPDTGDSGGSSADADSGSSFSASSPCAGCSGGDCSSCGS
ncbi:MAG: zinc ribbon domain-containing protein [Desulfovibrionaceae bacterium]|nr:zinc ribbon domain-containing protein [Desulfovibrionaceae bacterium]